MCLELKYAPKIEFTHGMAEVYKTVVQNNCGKWFSPYLRHPMPKKGVYKSGRSTTRITDMESMEERIDHGIHVFIQESDARDVMRIHSAYFENRCFVVKCLAYEKDFVASGRFGVRPSAVFTQIYLTNSYWSQLCHKFSQQLTILKDSLISLSSRQK